MIINDDIFKEILEKELEKYTDNKIFDDEIAYVYKKIAPKYQHTVKNMSKFISTLC